MTSQAALPSVASTAHAVEVLAEDIVGGLMGIESGLRFR